MPSFNGRNGEEADLETASFDGDVFAELGMEFGQEEDIVNAFLDAEATVPEEVQRDDPSPLPRAPIMTEREDTQNSTNTSTTASSSSSSPTTNAEKKDEVAKKGRLRRRKRPKGKPRRPLCGYNIFFQRHSKEIQATTAFKDLGRIMGEKWKALSEDERVVYEKEAEKDVIRFRREMDIFEKKRKERLCPSQPKASLNGSIKTFYPSSVADTSGAAQLQPPPGWSATNATTLMGGIALTSPPLAEHFANSANHNAFSANQGPPALPTSTTGLQVPGQFVGTPPPTMALPQGTEISLPDAAGMARQYRVVYACYRMTQKEANDYMARFAALTAGWQPNAVATPPPAATAPAPSPLPFLQAPPPPPQSPQVSRPTFSPPPQHLHPPHQHHHPHHSPHHHSSRQVFVAPPTDPRGSMAWTPN